ncbi:MAG: hypothetical protein ACYTEQ_24920 [Planctomycetota bacterium]|jgi:hypothetical protein
MALIENVLKDARSDLIKAVRSIKSVHMGRKFKIHKKKTPIRDTPGKERLYDVELAEEESKDVSIGGKNWVDREVYFNIIIGYPWGDEYSLAAIAEQSKIMDNVTFRTAPSGVQFYQLRDDAYWETDDDFRWYIIPVLCRIETTG